MPELACFATHLGCAAEQPTKRAREALCEQGHSVTAGDAHENAKPSVSWRLADASAKPSNTQ
jgi:hypothetical protein